MRYLSFGLGLGLLSLSQALPHGEKRQDEAAAPEDDDVEIFATRLNIKNCGGLFDSRPGQIRAGWKDSWLAMNEVAGGVNWNEAAALEFLGAPSTLGEYQQRIDDSIKQISTLQAPWIGTPFDWSLTARCDDPKNICPCLSNSKTYAYTVNDYDNDADSYINFCPRYFDAPLLKDKVNEMRGAPDSEKHNINSYHGTKGHIWFHELSHWNRGNLRNIFTHVTDYWIEYIRFQLGVPSTTVRQRVYGGFAAKLLARWNDEPGQYLYKSADNLALYATAKYVQKQLGRYPDLPILPVSTIPKGSPLPDDPTVPFITYGDNDEVIVYDAPGSGDNLLGDSAGCANEDGEDGDPEVLQIKKLNDKSAYPDEYLTNLEQRVAELGGSSGGGGDNNNDNDWKPLPADTQPSCGGNALPANFPSSWAVTDGSATAGELLYRMRDQACQRKCESIQGVPGSPGNPSPEGFFASAKVSDTGCEYSVKIGADRELYFYATNDGQSCYDATEKLINNCVNEAKKDAGWVNGPNYGEFYQVGVRKTGEDQWGHINSWPQDGNKDNHLGFKHVACQRTDNGKKDLWYSFRVEVSGWDDGNWGRTIRDEAKGCGLTTEWKYEDENDYTFGDGTKAQKWAGFRLPLLIGDRCGEHAIETALGLARDSLTCKRGEWNEVSYF